MKARFLIAETLAAALLAVPIFAQVKPTDEKVSGTGQAAGLG